MMFAATILIMLTIVINPRWFTFQVFQGERDKAISTSKSLWRKIEEMKRDKEEMQKRMEQNLAATAAQRGHVRN